MTERFPYPTNIPDAYFAGVFDGEGWVHVGSGSNFCVQVAVKMVHPAAPTFFKDRWGGVLYTETPKNPKHSPTTKWMIFNREAASCLRDMMPWLLCKRSIARIGIEAGDLIRVGGAKGCSVKLTEEEKSERNRLSNAAKEENMRGPK